MIDGEVYIDLTEEPEPYNADRRKLAILESCPDRSRVIVDIGKRRFISLDAATWIHNHGDRLDIIIRGDDPAVLSVTVPWARSGDWPGVA